jgi:hypothetical protein
VRKIDAFAHILPPSYARRLEPIMSGGAVSQRILGYQPWIHEDPALTGLDARWRVMDAFGDYRQVLTLAVPPLEDPARAEILAGLKRDPMDYFRGFYADTAMFGAAHAARYAVDFFGADHVLFGTDMPLGGPTVVEDTIADIEALDLPDADAAAIFGGNAGRVLRIPA